MSDRSPIAHRRSRIFLAWCVHLFTALGLVAAGVIAVLIVRGGAASFRWAFLLMLAATVIDGLDGSLARWARVKDVLPGFDGRRLDDIIDFLNYTFLPLLLLWRAELLPPPFAWCLLVPLVASAYGFCQVSSKTDDGYFLGFPSYWNVVAFYLYVLRPPGWVSVGVSLTFALLTFFPIRYLYPSQRGRLNQLTCVLAILWSGLALWILFRLPADVSSFPPPDDHLTRTVALVSLVFPLYYIAVSWSLSLARWVSKNAGRTRRDSDVQVP
jgi:phosphatidylcholine synthase